MKSFEHGYQMGYDWVAYENGNCKYWYTEVRNRGLEIKSQYGIGFKTGAIDAYNKKDKKY